MRGLCVVLAIGLAAVAAFAHGSFHDRVQKATKRIEASPKDPDAWLARSVLYRNHGDVAKARSDLARVAALAPARRDLDFFRGKLELAAGRPEAAVTALRRFLAAEPEHPAAHAALAEALALVGKPADAAVHYTRALAIEPVPIPEHYLARARAQVAAGSPDEALRGLDEGMRRLGPIVSLALPAVEIEVARGHTDAALARLDAVAATAGRQETWLARRAEILESAGRLEAARETWDQVRREIEKLPASRRDTPAMAELAAKARAAQERLAKADADPAP